MSIIATLMKPYVKSVQNSAEKYGGRCSWAFSQCLEPVASIIGKDKVTADGICEMLSAKWIDEHAHGRSLRGWLCTDGASIDPSKIRLLMQLFIIGESMRPEQMIDSAVRLKHARYGTTDTQSKATDNYLKSHGLKLVDNNASFEVWRQGSMDGGEKIKHGLAAAIAGGQGSMPAYRTIGVWGKVGGHAMAGWKGDNAVHYFDPNFGEFQFGDRDTFITWFTKGFYPKSFYTKFLGNNYEVRRYELA